MCRKNRFSATRLSDVYPQRTYGRGMSPEARLCDIWGMVPEVGSTINVQSDFPRSEFRFFIDTVASYRCRHGAKASTLDVPLLTTDLTLAMQMVSSVARESLWFPPGWAAC